MICVFPDPYPDELLYSVCARYSALMGYPNKITATCDFFGGTGVAAVVDLPNRLGHLINALPPGHLYSVDELIYRHTHYPFYAPFLPRDRALLVRDTMRSDGNNRVAERIGISADRLKMPTHLRFCPSCVRQDKARFGETYWHRIHQVPCVEVCPHHATFLEQSNALWRNSQNPGEAFAAEHSINDTPARALNPSEHIQSIQLSIARQALWLLEWSTETVGGQTLGRRYHNLLLRLGLACYNGQVRTAQLTNDFLTFHSSEFLKSLGCGIRNPYSNWLMRLLHTHKSGVAQHPIRHILFLISIGSSAPEVLESFVEFKPFGHGPWPCLNHASGHYAELRVTDCRIRQGEKKNIGKPVGTFSCSCGFVYTRTGSDQSEEARFEWSSIQSYGIQWESRLKELWDDASQPLKEIALKLGVNELTVKRRAISIGLTFPRPHSGLMRSNGAIPDRYQIKSKSHQEIRDTKHNDLLFLINNNPWASRTTLLSLAPHLIDWLRQHDREWMDAALPLVKKKRPPTATIDWGKQDVMLSEAVKNAAVSIRSRAIPKRVSLTSVIKLIGYRSWIQKRLVKLPLTSQALDTHLESFEDYSIRRIAWTAASFRKEGRTPSIAMLSKRAGIKGRLYGKSKRVQSLLASTSRN